jgi:hypothetical protein
MPDLAMLELIARREFADIVLDVQRIDAKLRMILMMGAISTSGGLRSRKAASLIIGAGCMWMVLSIGTIILRLADGSILGAFLNIIIRGGRTQ